jgi:hypothetical protein
VVVKVDALTLLEFQALRDLNLRLAEQYRAAAEATDEGDLKEMDNALADWLQDRARQFEFECAQTARLEANGWSGQ